MRITKVIKYSSTDFGDPQTLPLAQSLGQNPNRSNSCLMTNDLQN